MQNSLIKDITLTLIRYELEDRTINEATKVLLNNRTVLSDLYLFTKKHDLSHLIALALSENNIVVHDEIWKNFQQQTMIAVYRYEQRQYALDQLKMLLGEAEVSYIPLKGAIIQTLYPQAWFRTSCDIDILIHQEDVERTIELLVKNGYEHQSDATTHDYSFITPGKVHLELHYSLNQGERMEAINAILDMVWACSSPFKESPYCFQMSNDMFVFYHIAHMAKHFEGGGCGIRPFIDLWILDNIKDSDIERRNTLLRKGNLLQFAEIARKLSKVWLENAPIEAVTEKMQNYILSGGVYGTLKNRIVVQQQKKGGRIKYALSKIFITYDEIKFYYPILQKHRWLTPIMQVRRWFKLVFCGHAKQTIRELSYNKNVSKAQTDEMKTFLNEIGL